ncbi:MAG: acetate--CoA ligase [Deltaproteobacteria bacterium]|nr:acetate--CoA ligase [Deltaproteobacteria bacterium]
MDAPISIDSISQEKRVFPPPPSISKKAWIPDLATYQKMYERSIADPAGFWASIAADFFWFKKWDKVLDYEWNEKIQTKWFEGGETNLCVNALDRHLPARKNQTAFIWVGNEPGEERKISYGELFEEVCRLANVLKSFGVKKGDTVSIYMPMIPELPAALLACARIGAVHSVIFGGFSPESLKDRILDCGSKILLTADGGFRGNKNIPIKPTADAALEMCEKEGHRVTHCLVARRTGEKVAMKSGRDFEWKTETSKTKAICEPEKMGSEDPLFILYTSGSTGKPKGMLHTTAGYMVFAALTFKHVFDYHEGDLYWCTADIGWVTGHSYIVYGPLCVGATSLMFEGIPNYPKPDRFWEIIEKYKVNTFYTAPTAIRALMREGEEWPTKRDLSSLKILGSVGEPINPEAWIWYYKNIGREKCPIVDTWWQTETGGILITPLPGAMNTKPGSASLPFFGVEPEIFDENGKPSNDHSGGYLVIKKPWPGIARTVYGEHQRLKETYFSRFPGVYFTGDGARKDEDGFYWLMGRIDDVLNVSGHRIGTAEVESALVSHTDVAEAAVVGFPHDIKGQGIYAYVTLKSGKTGSEEMKKTLTSHVRKENGPIASPDKIHFTDALPKTRSGKIMRRILRKIAEGKPDEIGDTSTLADPVVVESLLKKI